MNMFDFIRLQKVSFELPTGTARLLDYYCVEQKMIEPNQFIINSLNSFVKHAGRSIKAGDIREVLPCEHITLKIDVPILLLFKLLLLSYRVHISLSGILYAALGYSLPLLVETEQIQEYYSFEQNENIRE